MAASKVGPPAMCEIEVWVSEDCRTLDVAGGVLRRERRG